MTLPRAPLPSGPDDFPEDLQSSYVGPYTFPDTARRRIPAVMYAVSGAVCLAAYVVWGDGVLINGGVLGAGIVLLALAVWHWLAAWPLRVDEVEALARAGQALDMPIGPASALLSWRGLRSRPVWRVVVFSPEDPPLRRGVVVVDGVDGDVLLAYAEDNPEDWSDPTVATG